MQQLKLPNIRNIARGIERKAVKAYMAKDKHEASNLVAAEVILADVERWGPGLEKWARLFMARIGK